MRWVFRIAGLFAWLLVPLANWALLTFWGSPHVIWGYTYSSPGGKYGANRHYHSCTYVGWHSVRTIPAHFGRCACVAFLKAGQK